MCCNCVRIISNKITYIIWQFYLLLVRIPVDQSSASKVLAPRRDWLLGYNVARQWGVVEHKSLLCYILWPWKQLRILRNNLLHYFNSLLNVLRVIERNNLRWAKYEGCVRRVALYLKYWPENIKRRVPVRDCCILENSVKIFLVCYVLD